MIDPKVDTQMSEATIRLLLVEDDPAHAEAVRRTLTASMSSIDVRVAESLDQYRRLSAECIPDIVVMDLNLPDGTALEALCPALGERPLPIIVMTSYGNEESAVNAMKSGAIDYIVKSPETFTSMHQTIDRALREWTLRRQNAEAQDALRENEARQRSMIANIADVIVIMDRDFTITYESGNIEKYFGWTPSEHIGRSFTGTVHHDDREHLTSVFDTLLTVPNTSSTIECRFLHKDGTNRMIHLTAVNLLHDLNIRGVLINFHDITDQKRLEQQLVQAQKLEGIGTLAGGIAHDFNNLLAMVLGSAELLELQLTDRPELKKYVDRIIDASVRGKSISRQLLIFSRPELGELKHIVLNRVIGDLQEMLAHFLPKSILIETSVENSHCTIMGDDGQIHQALLNLALNAGDAMAQNGRLTIRQFSVPAGSLDHKFPEVQPIPYAAVSISDTGTGMDPATLAKIFDPFFSTKERAKGTGLGLAIVHGIMKQHRGFIDVQSVPGSGTTFTLYFPLGTRVESDVAAPSNATLSDLHGTILIVDDEPLLLETLTEYLSSMGLKVYSAASANEAIRIFCSSHHKIDLVLTDLGMPEMGGDELHRHLRTIDDKVRVIVASGYIDAAKKDALLQSGICDVLTKPFRLHDVQNAIRTTMAKAAQ